MAAVPRDLRDGGYALGADKLQVSTRIVVPAAISGIIAAYVLGFSRAVGETMIVLIAAGQLAQITSDPREPIETMTAFIGATGFGDVPTGSTEYKTIFAVGLTLFVMTLVAEPALDQARTQVPRGLRMTEHRSAHRARLRARARTAHRAARLEKPPVQGRDAPVDVRRVRDARGAAHRHHRHGLARAQPEVSSPRRRRRCRRRRERGRRSSRRSISASSSSSSRSRSACSRRSTSRSTRTATRWWNRLIEVNIQNLAAVPSIIYGILGLAFIVRGIGVGRVVLAGRSDPDARRASDGRRRVARGDPRRPRLDPAGRVRARRDEVAGRVAAGAAGLDPGHRDRRRSSRSPVPSARPRRCSWSGRRCTSRSIPSSSAPYTALPVQIYHWVRLPGPRVPDARRGRRDRAARDRAQHERRGNLPSQPLPEAVVRGP